MASDRPGLRVDDEEPLGPRLGDLVPAAFLQHEVRVAGKQPRRRGVPGAGATAAAVDVLIGLRLQHYLPPRLALAEANVVNSLFPGLMIQHIFFLTGNRSKHLKNSSFPRSEAEAGIHNAATCGFLDCRFRGNDGGILEGRRESRETCVGS